MMNDFLCPKIREFDEKATIYLKKKICNGRTTTKRPAEERKKIQNNRKQS